jgi:hypothetical protein
MINDNLVITISVPQTLKLTDGRIMGQSATFSVVGDLHPYYCSVDEVRLEGGTYLRRVVDLTIASMIYHISREADVLSYSHPFMPPEDTPEWDPVMKRWRNFEWAREHFVHCEAARNLILNVFDLAGTRGHRTLGNFAISRQEFTREEGLPGKLRDLEKEVKEMKLMLKSGATIGPGGHVRPRMAAKYLYDSNDIPRPGRLWITSGPGANAVTIGSRSSTGGHGKPTKYYSPFYVARRLGRYTGPVITSVGYFGVI